MASIHKVILIENDPQTVWEAVRDVGAVHERLVPGVLTDTVFDHDGPDGAVRTVTFANGLVVRELIVDLDDEDRRFAYSVVGDTFTHHHASMQVFDVGDGYSRLVWISDVLPDEAAELVAPLVEEGSDAMQRTLKR